ncbi:MAG: alpha/beta hydrolase [Actinobacteria bacterium]|nr:alpha/beta hydrolase [Actinomycetota bacterium]
MLPTRGVSVPIRASDGTGIHVEEVGQGDPILFLHEFAGDHRSWQPQVRAFSRNYRCITYAARGYPPSEVPRDPDAYSQERAVADAIDVLDALELAAAHVVGVSMGGFATLHLGLEHPSRARSLVVAGCGYGAQPERVEAFRAESGKIADAFAAEGSAAVAERYAVGPTRVQFQRKDPSGWEEFARQLAEHDPLGAELTMRGVQAGRPSLYALQDELAEMPVPTLLVTGDEDEGCLEASLMLKRTIPAAGLAMLPRTGHTCNLEEPELFNRLVGDFLRAVDLGGWPPRDPRSLAASTTGMDE